MALARTSGIPLWMKWVDVYRKLAGKGLTPEQIHLLFSFVDRVSPLTPVDFKKFKEHIYKEEKEVYMIMTSFE